MKKCLLALITILSCVCVHATDTVVPKSAAIQVVHTASPIVVDGKAESLWEQAQWQAMPYLMDGSLPKPDDFSGRYKLLWDSQYLYLQAEIVDDLIIDKIADPLDRYWDDDCLEIFIDSDASGGIHQYNHSAFAYHIGVDNQAADIGPDKKAHLYTDHLQSRWQRSSTSPHLIIWEVAIKLYANDYQEGEDNTPLALNPRDVIGFMLAYCDNDGSEVREHFMGSHDITPVDGSKNRGYIDASVFGKIVLLP
jgi:hypothetical protein